MSEWKLKPLDKNGFVFAINTLWNKIKATIPTRTSDLKNDSNFGVVVEISEEDYEKLPEDKLTNNVAYYIKSEKVSEGDVSCTGDDTIGVPTPVQGTIEVMNGFLSKRNGIVHFTMYCKALRDLRDTDVVLTLPEGFKPKLYFYSAPCIYVGNTMGSDIGPRYPFVMFSSDGSVIMVANAGTYLMIDTTYIPANS